MAAADDLALLRQFVCRRLQPFGARVFLFGSQARGDAHEKSDIDLAVDAPESMPAHVLAELRLDLEDSNVLRAVDLVDLRHADPALRSAVAREGVPWTV